ncbi:MAG TPA: hypothetical protein VI195_00390 [Steroidobacteraceae bacterium]
MRVTRRRYRSSIWLQRIEAAGACPEHHMSDDAKLGLILLFMVFALMVIGPVIAG